LEKGFFEKYKELRAATDSECIRLETIHSGQMVCRKGCTSCCMDFSILPVEFYTVADELKGKNTKFNQEAEEGECPMLVGGLCTIYESRPFICRSHGLPLLSMGEEGWELSHCELNFREYASGFDESNALLHDRWNSELFMLNREFIKTLTEVDYFEFDLIPLTRLKSILEPNAINGG
jgi:Fe-S-cluster containining protein